MGPLRLRTDEVHVWQAVLDSEDISPQDLEDLLSEDEISRANRFHFQKDRKQFVVSRGILRTLLGNYLSCLPKELILRYTPYGKPFIENKEGLRFNLAHSQGVAVFGFSIEREIGIDVEQIRQISDMEVLAARFFCKEETAKLMRLLPSERCSAFFRCWTRKEAYIKGLGNGLRIDLDQFEVSFSPGEPTALLRSLPGFADASQWNLREIPVEPGYVGAVVAEGPEWNLTCFNWTR
jgi:4'-phosphopantetheinyl transferase